MWLLAVGEEGGGARVAGGAGSHCDGASNSANSNSWKRGGEEMRKVA